MHGSLAATPIPLLSPIQDVIMISMQEKTKINRSETNRARRLPSSIPLLLLMRRRDSLASGTADGSEVDPHRQEFPTRGPTDSFEHSNSMF
jgi:hypothetical protein